MRVLFLVSDYTEFLFIYPAHSFWMLRNLTRMCSHFCHFCWSGIVCSSYCNGANTDLRLWRHPRRGVVGLLRGHLEIGTEGCLDASRISMISAAGSFLVLRPRSLPLDWFSGRNLSCRPGAHARLLVVSNCRVRARELAHHWDFHCWGGWLCTLILEQLEMFVPASLTIEAEIQYWPLQFILLLLPHHVEVFR